MPVVLDGRAAAERQACGRRVTAQHDTVAAALAIIDVGVLPLDNLSPYSANQANRGGQHIGTPGNNLRRQQGSFEAVHTSPRLHRRRRFQSRQGGDFATCALRGM